MIEIGQLIKPLRIGVYVLEIAGSYFPFHASLLIAIGLHLKLLPNFSVPNFRAPAGGGGPAAGTTLFSLTTSYAPLHPSLRTQRPSDKCPAFYWLVTRVSRRTS